MERSEQALTASLSLGRNAPPPISWCPPREDAALLRAMAPVAPLVCADRPDKIGFGEACPKAINEPDFAVRQLPQEKVGHPLLPRGADHEVRVGHAAGVQVLGHPLFTDVLQADLAVRV